MDFLSTGFALLCAAVAAICCWRCARAVESCDGIANDLARSRAKILSNEHALDALSLQLRRLNGRLNAMAPGNGRPRRTIDQDGIEQAVDVEIADDELAAELQLQRAAPVAPGRGA